MTDKFPDLSDSVQSPSSSMFAVLPNDTVALQKLPKALYVGTAGDVTLRCVDDVNDVVFRYVSAGAVLRVRPSFVRVPQDRARHAGPLMMLGFDFFPDASAAPPVPPARHAATVALAERMSSVPPASRLDAAGAMIRDLDDGGI